MSTTQIQVLEARLLDQAQDLANTLDAISTAYWGPEGGDAPLLRLLPSTRETLKELELLIAAPISEIEAAE